MLEQRIKQVLVVGGGTAGWLTAANMAKQFNSVNSEAIQVTLIESPNIPSIGVGEGTWPTMRKTLAKLGIKEHTFINGCHASLKQGTKFVNWREKPVDGNNQHYYHLFTSIYDPADFNLAPYWQVADVGYPLSYADTVSAQARLCDLGLAPKSMLNKAYEGVQNYAYHLDAGLFSELLKKHALEQLGVKFISANVSQVNLADDGDIRSVNTDVAGELTADFFVDCSGFQSLLLGKALGVPLKPIDDTLFTDHALTIQVPYTQPQTQIASCTISTAHSAGWTWDIGLANRRGTGYVYSSAHTSHEAAEQTLRDYLGPQANQLDARLIKMTLGYREKFWHNNCVAIGLSAGFIEPLEASAIFLIEAAANMVSELMPVNRATMELVADKFNQSFTFRWQKTIEFIKMHYFLSQRQEPFWQDNKRLDSVPESLLAALERWRDHPLSNYDFDHVYEPFPMESYQYVLYGMGFGQNLQHQRVALNQHQQAQQAHQQVLTIAQHIAQQLPTNRDLLNKVANYPFQSI